MAIEQPAPRIPDKKAPRWRQEPSITPFPKPLQPPTKEEAEAANRGDYKEGGITGFIKKHPLISGGTAAGIAAAAAYEAVPAFHQAVDSTYHDVMQKLGVEIVVPLTFGNKAGSGVIGDNNIYPLSEEAKSKSSARWNRYYAYFSFPVPVTPREQRFNTKEVWNSRDPALPKCYRQRIGKARKRR